MQETVISRAGLERLSAQLDQLAAERGAREDQTLLEQRIAVIEDRLRSARVVEPQLGNGRIDLGEWARLRDLDSGERLEVELVGPYESDPAAGRISIASPLGRAIAGLRRGQVAAVDAPRGTLHFEVLAVEARR
jgi:transcription elongation factor GreA